MASEYIRELDEMLAQWTPEMMEAEISQARELGAYTAADRIASLALECEVLRIRLAAATSLLTDKAARILELESQVGDLESQIRAGWDREADHIVLEWDLRRHARDLEAALSSASRSVGYYEEWLTTPEEA